MDKNLTIDEKLNIIIEELAYLNRRVLENKCNNCSCIDNDLNF